MGLGLGAGVGKIKNEIVSDTNSKVEHAGLCMAGQGRGKGRVGKSRCHGHFGSRYMLRLDKNAAQNLSLPKLQSWQNQRLYKIRTLG